MNQFALLVLIRANADNALVGLGDRDLFQSITPQIELASEGVIARIGGNGQGVPSQASQIAAAKQQAEIRARQGIMNVLQFAQQLAATVKPEPQKAG